jgi:HK97 family phage major capsid protein
MMTDGTAPETKGGDISEAFGEFMNAFEAFREANDDRIAQIETRFGEDAVTAEKVDRIGRALDEQKRAMDQLVLKKARPALGRDKSGSFAGGEHKEAFEAYVRRGDERALQAIDQKAMSYGSGPDGGYLVPEETETEIGKRLASLSPIRSIASVRQVSTAVLKKPFSLTGPATGWVAETAARPQTNTATLSELSFPAMELYAMPAATASLLEDSAVDLDQWIASEVEAAFAEQEGLAFVSGNGANKPKGFLDYDTVADGSWTWGNLGYVATGVDGALPASDPSDVLIDLIYALRAGYRQNASFVMNRKVQASIRKLKDADGNYLWQPPAAPGSRAMLMGFPVVEAEDMPDAATDATPIAFGDFGRGYLVVDRTGVRVLRDPYSAKPYVLFYTTKRVGGGVQDFNAIKLLKFGEACTDAAGQLDSGGCASGAHGPIVRCAPVLPTRTI